MFYDDRSMNQALAGAGRQTCQRLRLAPSELAIGMYVERIDRPWSETEFAYQGFPIEHEEDIHALNACCDWVEVSLRAMPQTLPAARLLRPRTPRMSTPAGRKRPLSRSGLLSWLAA